ncbi:zf-HC2 domain-containing protein [Arthrobacter sp. zg-Y820]|uniref:zf-HC2 domain-containing protein n=1 Tax=unclassified Arthrobacter TaxID=235627 RepID=UPI001E649195|nr:MULTISPECIES: zf-HC2 domain-containing protein [unclassified Arthrobacter]MCC9195916.1 zf-HC2 domain-containing protein [Arthrobacter sp. zg-Y820]MDK1278775.1 zf-HC2 domain-containing protein [Arthrobacter sp. zg.Y820]WIB08803.1 zf-HC2 domain-containing protein [Arthrobacter sp. zg-Y820]
MRHPKRLLQEYLDNTAGPATTAAVETHLSRCDQCRAEAARERRRRSRMRSAQIPEPGPELRGRIEQTPQMGAPGAENGYAAGAGHHGGGTRHLGLMFAAGAIAAVGLVLSTAYLLGGLSPDPSLNASAPGLASGWSEVTGGEANQLTREQIDALRTRGWACPELQAEGMSLVAAHSARIAGQPAVVMTLEGQGSTVTIHEARSDSGARGPAIDGISGHSVLDEGFILQEQESGPGRPDVWFHPQRPHQAVVASRRVTYTVSAAPSGDVLDQAVSEISLSESSRLVLHTPDTAQGVWERIQRGLSAMTGAGA